LFTGCIEQNIDFSGSYLSILPDSTLIECQKKCSEMADCHVWTFMLGFCSLKAVEAINHRQPRKQMIAGTKHCPGNFK
jgi:hypothetical protein